MSEDILRNEKTWGIEDAIIHLQREVDSLNIEIKSIETKLGFLHDKRNSLDIGLKILQASIKVKKDV